VRTADVLAGAAVGSVLTFFLDPNTGRRRRALVRDKATSARRHTIAGLDATTRDVANRARGVAAKVRRRRSDEPVSDETLIERVRTAIGRASTHPHAIDVIAQGGHVRLCGPVLADEVSDILAAAAAVRGVNEVIDALDVHDSGTGIPSLQGEGRVSSTLRMMPGGWSSRTRALVATGVIAAGAYAAAQAARTARAS
jgi:hypothetical protein